MGDGGGLGDVDGRRGWGGLAAGDLVAGADDGVGAGLGGLVDEVGGAVDEGEAVLVEGADELVGLVSWLVSIVASLASRQGALRGGEGTYLVPLDGLIEVLVALGVHIIRVDEHALLPRGDGERPDARHDVAHDLPRLEAAHEARVLGLELRVPVDLCVVEGEDAVVLLDLDVEVVGAVEDLVAEGAELGLGADVVDLVDDGLEAGDFVEDDVGDDLFVGEVLVSQVEVDWGGA